MLPELDNAFRYHRRLGANGRGIRALDAIVLARRDVAAATRRYVPEVIPPYSAGSDEDLPKSRFVLTECGARWHDAKAHLDHTGWYVDETYDGECLGGDKYRSTVLQLPARNGVSRYYPAYEMVDDNDRLIQDGALVDFSTWFDDEKDAARMGDEMARIAAERAREWSSASDARRRFEELGEEISDARKRILVSLAERRAVATVQAPTLCGMLRDKVSSLIDGIANARKERAKLALACDHLSGWKDY